jgi:hypothetical protein
MTAAISLPRRNCSSISRFASADSDPRTRKVSLSSAASSWSGPWSGASASPSASHAPIVAHLAWRPAASADSRAKI